MLVLVLGDGPGWLYIKKFATRVTRCVYVNLKLVGLSAFVTLMVVVAPAVDHEMRHICCWCLSRPTEFETRVAVKCLIFERLCLFVCGCPSGIDACFYVGRVDVRATVECLEHVRA